MQIRTKMRHLQLLLSSQVSSDFLSRCYAQTGQRYDLLLKGGHVIDPANHIDEVRDIAVLQGKIAAVEKNIPADQAGKVVDVSNLYVTPGPD